MEKGIIYDWLIVGAGLSGAVFAREMTNLGYNCIIVEKKPHIGGMCYCEKVGRVVTHKYGAHIFHTDSQVAWLYFLKYSENVRRLGIYSVQAMSGGAIYPLPFNMNTFAKIWDDVRTPEEAKKRIAEQSKMSRGEDNVRDRAISQVGVDVYEKLIKGYTEKQWGKNCEELPGEILGRIPVRFTYDNNYYFCDKIGIPRGGYNKLFEKLTDGIDVYYNFDICENKYILKLAKRVFCTSPIDEFFDLCFGKLDYRSLRFETEVVESSKTQGCPVVNYCDDSVGYTRRIEHNQFTDAELGDEIVATYEYPQPYENGAEPYYPIPTEENKEKYKKYLELSKERYGDKIVWGGRLGGYRYIAMDDAILGALKMVDEVTMHK